MRQPVDTNILVELEEIEIEFWMYKYKRYDRNVNMTICEAQKAVQTATRALT